MPRPEHPRPQFERTRWINLNGTWTFAFDPGNSGIERGLESSRGFDEKILVPFCPESKLSGVEHTDFIETMWYHRAFSLPKDWHGMRILLHFGGVDYYSEVFVNGRRVGRHWGGGSPFSIDISGAATAGANNELVVRVRDILRSGTQPAGKQRTEYRLLEQRAHYTRTTGIWSTVWLEAVAPRAIKELAIIPDPSEGRFLIIPRMFSWGQNGGSTDRFTIRIRASIDDGEPVVSTGIAADGHPIVVALADPRLWEPGNPRLYDLQCDVVDGSGSVLDSVHSYAGLRSVRVDGNRVYVNENPVYQRLVLDQGFYPEGIWTAPSDEALKKDIQLSMAAGFNGARLHQKVFDERYHFWADRLGYLTWAEAPSWGMASTKIESARNFLAEWRAIVTTQRNHPSIITWTPLNETRDVEPDAAQHARFHEDLYDLTKTLDPSRPVNDSSGYVHVKTDLWTAHNYEQSPGKLDAILGEGGHDGVFRNFPEWEAQYGGQPYLLDEFGGILWIPENERGHAGDGTWGYGRGPSTIEEFYKRLDGLVDTVLSKDYICGYCYTQLTDVEQERNGVYTYQREPKFDMDRIRKIFLRKPSR